MYSITTTPGFIIDSRPYSEAGKMLSIFTRDLGLVTASAQGIRLEKSKLRYSSQLYSFGVFSFVRGKEFWRLTSSNEITELIQEQSRDFADTFPHDLAARGDLSCGKVVGEVGETVPGGVCVIDVCAVKELIARLAMLLSRLLHGEDPHPELFDCVFGCVKFLNVTELTGEQMQTLESLTVARMLHKLGYIGNDAELDGHIKSGEITIRLLDELGSKRVIINKHINKALKESHL